MPRVAMFSFFCFWESPFILGRFMKFLFQLEALQFLELTHSPYAKIVRWLTDEAVAS